MRRLVYGLIVVLVFFTGCSPDNKAKKEVPSAAVHEQAAEIKLAKFTEDAWLRKALPEKTVMYLRLPTPWFYFTGLENGFKYAQQNEDHVKQLEAIQQGLSKTISSQLDPAMQPVAALLLKHMIAPLEVAALMDEANPIAPVMVLATKLDFETIENFHNNLSGLLKLNTMVQETDRTDAKGYGSFAVPGVGSTSVYRFNLQTKELLVVTGSGLDKTSLDNILTGIKPISSHPMYALENTIDTSKKGLFGYIDAKQILPMIQGMIPPNVQLSLHMSGFDQMTALAFGYGASQGKSRLKVIVDMPDVGFRSYLPVANNSIDFSARGRIDSLGVMALPSQSQFKNIESLILSASGAAPEYTAFKQEFKTKAGVELGQIFDIIGPEVVYFSDAINDFIAIRLRNPEQFGQLIEKAVTMGLIKYDEHKKGSSTIKHVVVPFSYSLGMFGQLKEVYENDPYLSVLLGLFEKVGSHYYWIEEDGYIIMAKIPQPLVERSKRHDKVNVKKWLADSQKCDFSSAFAAFSMSKKDLSRDYYYHYLQLLRVLADMSGSELDFFAFPDAGQLEFAKQGSVGVSLDSSDKYLSLEANFEESLADVFYAGGMYETAAVTGIVAAIAIPQFEKYKEKAKQHQ